MKKGLSLPINLIVILAIAILVMVVVAAFFVMSTGSTFSGISDQQAWNSGCSMAKLRGCIESDFGSTTPLYVDGYDPKKNDIKDVNGHSTCSQETISRTDCSDDTLRMACEAVVGSTTPTFCRARCCG